MTRHAGLVAAAVAAFLSSGAYAGTSIDENDDALEQMRKQMNDLQSQIAEMKAHENQEIAELREEMARMKAEEGEAWMTGQRATEIRSIVEDVLADADARTSLLQSGGTAGWDKSFYLQSADGNWRLTLRGQIQFRFTWNHASDQAAATPARPNDLYGFGVRRAKIFFDGNVIDPSWTYRISVAVDDDNTGPGGVLNSQGDLDLEDAIIRKGFDNGITIWVGQYKPWFLREELVSSSRQQAVDRSFVNELYSQDRSVGVGLAYEGDMFRVYGMYNDGFGERNSTFFDSTKSDGFNARVEWLAAGNWGQFKDPQGWKGDEFAVMIGAALQYQKSRYGAVNPTPPPAPFTTPRLERFTWTIDASLEGSGWNAFAYVVGNHLNPQGGTSADQLGVVIQGGWLFAEDWDVFGRWEWSDLDIAGVPDVNLITLGVNRYFNKNLLKWTTDIGVGLDTVPNDELGIGWRADAPGQDGQIVVRSQMQLMF